MKIRLISIMLLALLLCGATTRQSVQAEAAPAPIPTVAETPEPLRAEPEAVFCKRTCEKEEEEKQELPVCEADLHEDVRKTPEQGKEAQDEPEIWREDVPLSGELQAALLAICEEYGVDPLLALGLIETESAFQPDVVSPTGDYGLCQLCPLYFPQGLNHEENIRAGIGYLAELLGRYKTTEAALTAYNRGHDDGTRTYAGVVLGHAAAWGYGAENGN